MEQEHIEINNQKLYFTIWRKNVKNINLRVNVDKKVHISVPLDMSVDNIKEFIEKKHEWINKQQKYFDKFSEVKENLNFENGETVYILGKRYLLNIEPSNKNAVEIAGRYMKIYVKESFSDNKKYISNIYEKWLKMYAMEIYTKISKQYEVKLKNYDVKEPKIVIRRMYKRWGTCLPKKNTVILNLKLVKTPIYCIEYVVLHELLHFRYPNHNKKFYNYLTIFMPDWHVRKKILDEEFTGVV